VDAELEKVPGFDPAYMLDQSHNVTDPIESLMRARSSSCGLRAAAPRRPGGLAEAQERNDAILALATLKQAFTTDVGPILAMARHGGRRDRPGGGLPASGYRRTKAGERPGRGGGGPASSDGVTGV